MRETDIKSVFDGFRYSERLHETDFDRVRGLPIMSKDALRATPMEKGLYTCRTSGSTGEPVSVEKSYGDHIWYFATNIREFFWRKWDLSKNIAVIRGDAKMTDKVSWGIPRTIARVQGDTFLMGFEPISRIQSWVEEKNPHYLQCLPSIRKQLDMGKVGNFIDHKGTGEMGGSMFSSEECGTISIQCPDNPSVHHVMENQIVEVDHDGGMIISTLTNPYIRRYKNGDHIELGKCGCGRSLQTIKNIKGRIRNMFVLPNGDRKWPLVGSRDYHESFGIKRYKVIQHTLDDIELQIVSDPLGDREDKLKDFVVECLKEKVSVRLTYVDGFRDYKFEEFVSLVKLNP
jgi:phenylacetate-coenzyme A ligase PaaK-like adenylate-forming protein